MSADYSSFLALLFGSIASPTMQLRSCPSCCPKDDNMPRLEIVACDPCSNLSFMSSRHQNRSCFQWIERYGISMLNGEISYHAKFIQISPAQCVYYIAWACSVPPFIKSEVTLLSIVGSILSLIAIWPGFPTKLNGKPNRFDRVANKSSRMSLLPPHTSNMLLRLISQVQEA